MQRQVRNIYLPVSSDQLIFVFRFSVFAFLRFFPPLSFLAINLHALFVCVCVYVDRCRDRAIGRCRAANLPQVALQQSGSPSPARCVPFETVLKSTNCLSNPHRCPLPHSPPQSSWPSVRQSVNCQAKSIAQLRFDLVLWSVRCFGKSAQISHCIHVQFHATCGIIVCCIRMAFHGQQIAVFQAFRQRG